MLTQYSRCKLLVRSSERPTLIWAACCCWFWGWTNDRWSRCSQWKSIKRTFMIVLLLIWKWRTSTCHRDQVRDWQKSLEIIELMRHLEDFPYEDRILKLLSECDDLIIKSKASQVLSVLQPAGKKVVPMEPVEEAKELIISPRSPPLSLDRQEVSSLTVAVKRSEIDDAPKPSGSLVSASYLSPLARKKAKRKSNEAIRKGSDSPSTFKVTSLSGSLGRATTRQWRSRSVPDALPNIFNLPSTGSDSALVKSKSQISDFWP